MKYPGPGRLVVKLILGAYLVTGIFSPRGLFVQPFHVKLDNVGSFQTEQAKDLDGRPYWMSHKHLTSLEQFSGDHLLSTAEPWTSVITPVLSLKNQSVLLPVAVTLFSANSLRAPPRS
ncbi:MAG: hypothetical protein WBZ48_12455 [Bacteroidota bacterium]